MNALCWMNGSILPASEARLPVLDHGLLYGDGVFEGIRFYYGRPFRLDAHLARLARSARAIALDLPLERPVLAAAVDALIDALGAGEGYLRLVVTRGVGALGISPASCQAPNVFIIAAPLQLVDEATRALGARVIVASTRRLPLDGLDPRIKSLNYLNHVLARIEAQNAGADEAILLNAAGRVAEGSADNVFIEHEGVLYTPPVCEGALAGVTRALILELAEERGLPCREQPLAPYDLYTADACFLTGTGAELIPVREIDGRPLPQVPGAHFGRLAEAFRACVRRECEAA